MRTLTIEAEKILASEEIGPYRITLRVMSYELPRGTPVYSLSLAKNWTILSLSQWTTWEAALREYEYAKRKFAVMLAEDVLFNQAKPEDQDNE